mmetsp:Transcript_14045/g.42478  ORF Transcript_14045/g.42478 Transcript_14045/m.42478 type:complete len:102 (-) Transcript_14045:314-619(-)
MQSVDEVDIGNHDFCHPFRYNRCIESPSPLVQEAALTQHAFQHNKLKRECPFYSHVFVVPTRHSILILSRKHSLCDVSHCTSHERHIGVEEKRLSRSDHRL